MSRLRNIQIFNICAVFSVPILLSRVEMQSQPIDCFERQAKTYARSATSQRKTVDIDSIESSIAQYFVRQRQILFKFASEQIL